MSSYVKSVDFSAKDALAQGNPNKIIKGTELNDEFNAIATAVGTKADLASPAFLGNPTATTQPFGNSSSRLATTAFVQTALQALYPIGTVYTSVDSTNPNTLFGFGTWVVFASGKTLIGVDASDTLFDTVEETGGSKDSVVVSHTHTITDPGHTHTVVTAGEAAGGGRFVSGGDLGGPLTISSNTTGVSVNSSGVSGTNANLPPFITVYFWKRTA